MNVEREVMIRVLVRLLAPIYAPGGGLGYIGMDMKIREIEEEVRAEVEKERDDP